MSSQQIDIVIIDSYPLFREGLKRALEIDPALRVVAEGDNGEQLLSLYKQYQPDVVMMEVNLSPNNGIVALRALLHEFPLAKVVFFTVVDDFHTVSQALNVGASGYLLKNMDSATIIQAIKTVVTGGFYLHPQVVKEFLASLSELIIQKDHGKFFQTVVRPPRHLLSRRECEVLQLLAEGQSNYTLGTNLEISVKTVKNHVSSILRKMKLRDRTQVVVAAIKYGWVELR